MEIRIDRASPVPIYLQIRGGIRDLILTGKLPDGFRLPPERELAKALGVNRTTVLGAYRALKSDGLVDAHVGRGTEVVARSAGPSAVVPVRPLPWRQLAREGFAREPDPLVRDLLAHAAAERVAYLPGGASFVEEPARNTLRLNFTFAPEDQLGEGVRRLARALETAQAEPRRGAHALLGTPPIV